MKKQQGFTLIELIVVIVILGILAATALPRFADLQGDARLASIQGAAGALRSAAAISHSTFIVRNTPAAGTVSIEGVTATNTNGYPALGEMADLAGLGATGVNYDLVPGAGILTVNPVGVSNAATCNVVYTEAANSATPATVTLNATQAGCQ